MQNNNTFTLYRFFAIYFKIHHFEMCENKVNIYNYQGDNHFLKFPSINYFIL